MRLLRVFVFYVVIFSNLYSQISIEVLFSPNDNVKNRLISLINNAKEKIYAAVFMITDRSIAESIINAKKRGVDVQVISDNSCIKSPNGKMDVLSEGGVDIFIFKGPSADSTKSPSFFNADPLMHNKFAIIDHKIWTGSFNWTHSANSKNHENVVIISDGGDAVSRFLKQFESLKSCCAQSHTRTTSKTNVISKRSIHKQIYDFLKDVKFKFSKYYPQKLAYLEPKTKGSLRRRQVKNKQKRTQRFFHKTI